MVNARLVRRDHKRVLIETSKTGISHSETVNDAIDEIIAKSAGVNTEAASAANLSYTGQTIPKLLRKRIELQKQGLHNLSDSTSS